MLGSSFGSCPAFANIRIISMSQYPWDLTREEIFQYLRNCDPLLKLFLKKLFEKVNQRWSKYRFKNWLIFHNVPKKLSRIVLRESKLPGHHKISNDTGTLNIRGINISFSRNNFRR
jgi:hypothetical protein